MSYHGSLNTIVHDVQGQLETLQDNKVSLQNVELEFKYGYLKKKPHYSYDNHIKTSQY